MIELRYTGMAFDEQELIDFMKASDLQHMVQGQTIRAFEQHTKPLSLDVWLRNYFPQKRDTKLADNYVIDALVKTGKFIAKREECPKTGRRCKAIRLV